jgi:membrane protein
VWLLSHWPGRIAVRSAYGAVQIGIFDRSMTIAAQIFMSVIPILILFATWADDGRTGAVADAVGMPDNAQSILRRGLGCGQCRLGVVGTIIVLASATSLSRALTAPCNEDGRSEASRAVVVCAVPQSVPQSAGVTVGWSGADSTTG